MSGTYPHPCEMALAPEGHALRFGIYKTARGMWIVMGNREDAHGDNWWSLWNTQADAFAAASAEEMRVAP